MSVALSVGLSLSAMPFACVAPLRCVRVCMSASVGLCVSSWYRSMCYTCNCSLFVSACACLWYCVRSSIRVLLSVYVLSLRVCMCLLRINRISKAELLVSSWMTRLDRWLCWPQPAASTQQQQQLTPAEMQLLLTQANSSCTVNSPLSLAGTASCWCCTT